jgi:hypothetical protein
VKIRNLTMLPIARLRELVVFAAPPGVAGVFAPNLCPNPIRKIRHGGSHHSILKMYRHHQHALTPATNASCRLAYALSLISAGKHEYLATQNPRHSLSKCLKHPLYFVLFIAAVTIGGGASTLCVSSKQSALTLTKQSCSPRRHSLPLHRLRLSPDQPVRLPEWRVNEERQLLMPYGLKVLGATRRPYRSIACDRSWTSLPNTSSLTACLARWRMPGLSPAHR